MGLEHSDSRVLAPLLSGPVVVAVGAGTGLSALPMAPAYWVGLRSVNMKLCVLGHADFPLGFRAHGFDTVVWSVCVPRAGTGLVRA
jgi:hypothetical protein